MNNIQVIDGARRVPWILAYLITVVVAASGQSFAQQQIGQLIPPPSFQPEVVRPRNYTDLVRNIKKAVDQAILSRREFYARAPLLDFLAGSEIRWNDGNVEHSHIQGRIFYPSTPRRAVEQKESEILSDLEISFQWDLSPATGIDAELSLVFVGPAERRPELSDIEAIFGGEVSREQLLPGSSNAHSFEQIESKKVDVLVVDFDRPGIVVHALFVFTLGRIDSAVIGVRGNNHDRR